MRIENKKNKTLEITDEIIGNKHEPIRFLQTGTIIFKNCTFENISGLNRIIAKNGTIILETGNRFYGDIEIECQRLFIKQSIATKNTEKQVTLETFNIEANTIVFDNSTLSPKEEMKVYAKKYIRLQTNSIILSHSQLKAKKGITIQTSQPLTKIIDCALKTEQTIKIYNTKGDLYIKNCQLEATKNSNPSDLNSGITIQVDNSTSTLSLENTKIHTNWLKINYNQKLMINKTNLTPLPNDIQPVGYLTIKNNTPQNIQSKAIFQKTPLDDYSTTSAPKEITKNDPLTKIMKMFIPH